MPFPSTLHASPTPKIIFFTDFDGTITLADTNDFMTDTYGFGVKKRREGNIAVLDGRSSFRDSFQLMIDSWTTSFPQTLEILRSSIHIDPHFADFVSWATAHHVPVIILSSGMEPVIRTLLEHHLPNNDALAEVEIIANAVQKRAPLKDLDKAQGWTIQYRDDSPFGHDKSLTIRPYAEAIAKMPQGAPRPILLYAGDGVSDLSAARETDQLFAKKGRDLMTYCEREGIKFTEFDDWSEILEKTKGLWDGRADIEKLVEDVDNVANGHAK